MSPISKEASSAYFASFFGSVHSLKPLLGTHCEETEMQKIFFCCLCRPQSWKSVLWETDTLIQSPSDYKGSSLGFWGLLHGRHASEAWRHPWILFL